MAVLINTEMKRKRQQERFLSLLEPRLEDLSRFCLAMTRDPEAGKDLMSDVILAAWERFDELRDDKAFLSFLFTIARRTYHRRRRREKLFGSYDEKAANNVADNSSPVWIGADVRALYKALGELPAAQREAVVLFEITGLSLKEVAEVQNASLSAVKSRITRGRERLAVLLGAETATSAARVARSRDIINNPTDLPASGNTLFST